MKIIKISALWCPACLITNKAIDKIKEEQNIEVMQRLGELTAYEYPVLLAPSRKRFIGSMLGGLPPEDRDEGTVAACITGVFQGVDMVRVHNVKMHKRALAVADGLLRGE